MNILPAEFLEKIVARLDDENTVGIALTGSFARNEAGCYSDVDLWHFVGQIPGGNFQASRLELIEGQLVSIKTLQIETERHAMQVPEKAIWTVPGWRQSTILLDRGGSLASVKEAALNLSWDSLQPAADTFASHCLSGLAEEIYKILDGLINKNECKTLYAIWSLSQDLANAMLVQKGIFIPTENVFIDHAQDTAGRLSEWTRLFRLTIGLDPLPADQLAYISVGIAGLHLYRETTGLLKKVILQEDAPLVKMALEVIQKAGY